MSGLTAKPSFLSSDNLGATPENMAHAINALTDDSCAAFESCVTEKTCDNPEAANAAQKQGQKYLAKDVRGRAVGNHVDKNASVIKSSRGSSAKHVATQKAAGSKP